MSSQNLVFFQALDAGNLAEVNRILDEDAVGSFYDFVYFSGVSHSEG